jgi:hypothetical protein
MTMKDAESSSQNPWSATDAPPEEELSDGGVALVASLRAWAAVTALGMLFSSVSLTLMAVTVVQQATGPTDGGDWVGPVWVGSCLGVGGLGLGGASMLLVAPLARPAPRDGETAAATLRLHLWAWRLLTLTFLLVVLVLPLMLCGWAVVVGVMS